MIQLGIVSANHDPSWKILLLITLSTATTNPRMINMIQTNPKIAIMKKEIIEEQTWIKCNNDCQTIFND